MRILTLILASLHGTAAYAFCGFYVAGGTSDLFNDATQVVLMRGGERTVLSMQNNYTGPTEDFALVVPVPVVLRQENVATLPGALFEKIDTLTAPRLVEYWQHDPCAPIPEYDRVMMAGTADDAEDSGVTVEAEFAVGEYQIVILSTDDASALQTYLTGHGYNIPAGASTHFQPYIDSDMYFFVAKVDREKVTFTDDGLAVLSPLRFYYDAVSLSLPVKLGLINSKGTQDLIVYTLAKGQRYEISSRTNVTIPTNISVVDAVRDGFGDFYRTLFARTLETHPGAAVTEYSWDASSCDPCPGPTLDGSDLETLGAGVMAADTDRYGGWVLTRLHLRYADDSVGDDLVFTPAAPIGGGRENWTAGALETGAQASSVNNFQGRYIIRHKWEGEVDCASPTTDQWGGPDGTEGARVAGAALSPNTTRTSALSATKQALEDLIAEDIPELGVLARRLAATASNDGCSCAAGSAGAFGWLAFLLTAAWLRRSLRSRAA